MSNVYVLDIETGATDESMVEFAALEPWRVRQGKAQIDSIAVIDPDGEISQIINHGQDSWPDEICAMLSKLKGKQVWAHNAIFDIAWMMATLQPSKTGPIAQELKDIHWFDSVLLARWIINGQKAERIHFSLSLKNLCATFLKDEPELEDFISLKSSDVTAGQDDAYWERRGLLDVIFTQKLVRYFKPKLNGNQVLGFTTENKCLIPVANSWLIGFRIDIDQLNQNEVEYQTKIDELCNTLNVPRTLISSPKQLANKLFVDMELPVLERTKTGAPSTGKDVLMILAYKLRGRGEEESALFLDNIMKAKLYLTLISKYVKTAFKALEHTGDGCIYGAPKLFSTYTGRMTYSNSTLRKFKTGIALHQIPRKANEVRRMLLPPVGFLIYEADASGQESRLMAIKSKDPTMIKIFQDDLNFHSMTGASIIGMDYYDFEEERAKENGHGYHTEQRQLGKLTNLSCNYRISGGKLARKAYVTYDTFMTMDTGDFLVNTFSRMYQGVPQYWKSMIAEARRIGYTETFSKRRFKVFDWSSRFRWSTESSVIMTPIQGAGADMKEIALCEMFEQVPEAMFLLDLHDATFNIVPEELIEQVASKCDQVLKDIDYEKYWGFKIPIPLPYESAYGSNFGEVK